MTTNDKTIPLRLRERAGQYDEYDWHGAIEREAADEIERLHSCLKTANANHEKFEREWYLRGDEIERLQARIAELEAAQPAIARAALEDAWISTREKLHPEKPGLNRYEQIPCLIVHNREVLLRLWNCEHLVWDDEDGDDFYCEAKDVAHWLPLPPAPTQEQEP